MLKNSVIVKINNALASHKRFELSDFHMRFDVDTYSTTVNIGYLGNRDYYMYFTVPKKATSSYNGGSYPGSVALKEEFKCDDIDDVLRKIEDWVDHIWDEMVHAPIVRMQKQQEDLLNEIFEKVDTISNDYFTEKEGQDILRRLDELEDQYRVMIENLIADTKERDAKIQIMELDIETLKSTINAIPKGFWNRSLLTKAAKIAKWGADKDNRKLLAEIIDRGAEAITGQKLLGS